MIRYLLTGVPGLDFPRSLPHRTTAAWSRRIFPCLLAVFILLALPHPAYAQGELCRGVPTSSWNETTHDAFVVLYTPGDLALASSTLLAQINQINAEYQRLEKLFETSLMLPVTIRIYPTRLTYSCLNALAPGIPPDASHARIGLREIALIGEALQRDPSGWRREGLDVLRYELAALFSEQISDRKAPPGLAAGVGAYAQDPQVILAGQIPSAPQAPTRTWASLWGSADRTDPVQQVSIVAFLVDTYGWPRFQEFLQALAVSDGYRTALEDVYQQAPSALEAAWRDYYPQFAAGRWEFNVLHNYDLQPYEALIAAGAYADAAQGLREADAFLSRFGDSPRLQQAREMLSRARLGQQAGDLTAQARQSLQEGQYERALQQVDEALRRYASLDDTRRLDELDAYRQRAQAVLALRGQLQAQIQALTSGGATLEEAQALIETSRRLGELGDRSSLQVASEALAQARQTDNRLRSLFVALWVVLALGLLALRLLLARRKPPLEASL
jgi:hypothetical protein